MKYTCDTYGRLTQVRHYPVTRQAEDPSQQVNYYYDSNPFDAQGFSQNTQGRLAAVTYAPVALHTQNPPPLPAFVEWCSYVQAGGVSAKRLQAQQALAILNAKNAFDSQGKIATVQYPTTYPTGNPVAGPTYKYGFDAMDRPGSTIESKSRCPPKHSPSPISADPPPSSNSAALVCSPTRPSIRPAATIPPAP